MSSETAEAPRKAPASADRFKQGMRRLLSGVSLITVSCEGEWGGLLATSVTSVTMAPPTLLVCVNQSASSHGLLTAAGAFCVNVLGRGAHPVADNFVSGVDRSSRFKAGEWRTLSSGAPALVGALAAFDCAVSRTIPYGTHTIFLGEIVDLQLEDEESDPLLYHEGGFVSLGGGRIGG